MGPRSSRAPGAPLTRRALLALPVAWLLAGPRPARAGADARRLAYAARVGVLYGALRFELNGVIQESLDRQAGRYLVRLEGQGTGISNHAEHGGVLREGRWAPVRTESVFLVHGRESRVAVAYDYERRRIEYRSRSETFFLRRLRVAEDVVTLPEGLHVDDVMSATLNYGDARWDPEPDGSLVTRVVRRRRGAREGVDDVEPAYRAELVPFVLKVAAERETGKPTAMLDLTRFSSWAREGEPARVVFGLDRRPEAITASLMLGTSVQIRITDRA